MTPPRLFLGLQFMLSATTLAYEILLMRLFSIVHWHHFSWMIISLALLGYGASGMFQTRAAGKFDRQSFRRAYPVSAGLFAVTAPLCFLLAQRLPFNALAIVWDPGQLLWLMLIFFLFFIPFFFSASCTCMALKFYRAGSSRVYAADLSGAGVGALAIILFLQVSPPMIVMGQLTLLAALVAAVSWLFLNHDYRSFVLLLLLPGIALCGLMITGMITLQPAEYKGLSQSLNVIGARITGTRSNALSHLSIVESPDIPFRYAPGMSLLARAEIPEQTGIFHDADDLSVITRVTDLAALDYLDEHTSRLPYLLLQKPAVLILGSGTGADVLQALRRDARTIDAVEINPALIKLLRTDYAEYAGHIYDRPTVRVHINEARGFVAASKQSYDLIQISMLDAFNTSAAGLYAVNESYLYTVEALREYLQHLSPEGILSISRWLRIPPRDDLKLFATVLRAISELAYAEPQRHIIWLRNWNTSSLLVSRQAFTPEAIASIRTYAEEQRLDLIFYAGIQPDEANRFNRLRHPWHYQAALELIGENAAAFSQEYKFHIEPATDDRPFFFRFFKWDSLEELNALRKQGATSLLDMGYIILLATFVMALILSGLFILLPARSMTANKACPNTGVVSVYFFSIGAGFIFLEIAFIQKFILYLSHPLYATSVVLSGFLIFAGLGSACSHLFPGANSKLRVGLIVLLMLSLLGVYYFLLPVLMHSSRDLHDVGKVICSLLMIAPLAWLMGLPFPVGLQALSGKPEQLMAWAWGINGFASVIGAIAAGLLAIHLGMNRVILIAMLFYLIAAGVYCVISRAATASFIR